MLNCIHSVVHEFQKPKFIYLEIFLLRLDPKINFEVHFIKIENHNSLNGDIYWLFLADKYSSQV